MYSLLNMRILFFVVLLSATVIQTTLSARTRTVSSGNGISKPQSGGRTTSGTTFSGIGQSFLSTIHDSISGNGNTGTGSCGRITGYGNSFTGDVNLVSGSGNSVKGNVISVSGINNVVTGNVNSINGSNNKIFPGNRKVPNDRSISISGINNFVEAHNYGPCNTNHMISGKKIQIINTGVIIDGHTVTYCGFQGYPRKSVLKKHRYAALSLQDISDTDSGQVNNPQNTGYLVHYAPNGDKWRTNNEKVIQNVLKDDKRSIINDGGYTEYFSADGHLSWSKNEGIIENGRFVRQSENLLITGDTIEFHIRSDNVIKWPKTTVGVKQENSGTTKNSMVENDIDSTITKNKSEDNKKDSDSTLRGNELADKTIDGYGNTITATGQSISSNSNDSIKGNGNTIRGSAKLLHGNGNFFKGKVESVNGNGNSIKGDVTSVTGNGNSINGHVISLTGHGNSITGNINKIDGNGNHVSPGDQDVPKPKDRSILVEGEKNRVIAHNYGPCRTNQLVNGKKIQSESTGIIIEGNKVTYCGFAGYPAKDVVSKQSDPILEDISKMGGQVNDPRNIGYLVHYSPNGDKWRTNNEAFIQEVLNGGKANMIVDGGYTEYNSKDRLLSWSKNAGIIENGKFVLQSDHLSKKGNYIVFRCWYKNAIRWPNKSITTKGIKEEEDDVSVFSDEDVQIFTVNGANYIPDDRVKVRGKAGKITSISNFGNSYGRNSVPEISRN